MPVPFSSDAVDAAVLSILPSVVVATDEAPVVSMATEVIVTETVEFTTALYHNYTHLTDFNVCQCNE